jgi:hypothetical protein
MVRLELVRAQALAAVSTSTKLRMLSERVRKGGSQSPALFFSVVSKQAQDVLCQEATSRHLNLLEAPAGPFPDLVLREL